MEFVYFSDFPGTQFVVRIFEHFCLALDKYLCCYCIAHRERWRYVSASWNIIVQQCSTHNTQCTMHAQAQAHTAQSEGSIIRENKENKKMNESSTFGNNEWTWIFEKLKIFLPSLTGCQRRSLSLPLSLTPNGCAHGFWCYLTQKTDLVLLSNEPNH